VNPVDAGPVTIWVSGGVRNPIGIEAISMSVGLAKMEIRKELGAEMIVWFCTPGASLLGTLEVQEAEHTPQSRDPVG
jgi:hypothetical protein